MPLAHSMGRPSPDMGLKFNCPNSKCRQRIEVEDALAGTEVSCPACAAKVRVPASHDIRFNCRTADCGQHLVVDVSEAGRFVKCPACGKPQQVPGDPPKSAFPQPTAASAKSGSQSSSLQELASPRWFAFLPVALSKRIAHLKVGLQDGFLPAAGTLLALLGMLKLWGWLGSANFSGIIDPVIGINSGILMLGIGLAEIAVAAVCLLTGKERLAVALVAWLATNFVVYRAGLWWMGWQRPCSCLGYLSDALRISPQAADVLSLVILAFLLVGSYGWLFWQWRKGRGGIANKARGVK
jgi:DNA-directed RNA polymerase subunit RPC12/RpoP